MAGSAKASLSEIRFFARPEDFRKWLKAHHEDSQRTLGWLLQKGFRAAQHHVAGVRG